MSVYIEPITQVHSNSRPGIPRPDIVVVLVDDGADSDVTVHSWTPFLLAEKAWHYCFVDHLVANGPDVNAEDYHGRRAHWAAKHGGTTLATFLPENGAKVDAKYHWSVSGLELVVDNKRHSDVELLQRVQSPSLRPIARDSESPLPLIQTNHLKSNHTSTCCPMVKILVQPSNLPGHPRQPRLTIPTCLLEFVVESRDNTPLNHSSSSPFFP